jgi:hypothetical protein
VQGEDLEDLASERDAPYLLQLDAAHPRITFSSDPTSSSPSTPCSSLCCNVVTFAVWYWEPLLPDNGQRGRQWREHRAVLEAILWVLTGGASWRDLPEDFGPWQTAYYRYARWRREDLWQHIVEMLRC